MNAIRWFALVSSSILVVISFSIMILERTITAEAWAVLLLAPVPVGFAVTARNGARNESAEMGDWSEDSDIEEGKSVGDPAESGFDIPVL